MATLTFAGVVAILTTATGIIVKVIGLPDQIRRNYKRQSTEGLSAAFWSISFFAYALWTLHGALQHDWALIIGQGLGIVTTGVILVQIFIYRQKNETNTRTS